jgi:hypothetical protein
VYEALFLKSSGRLGPRDIDELLIWEVAVLLGAGTHGSERDDVGVAGPRARALSRRSAGGGGDPGRSSRVARLKARLAYHKGEGPAPSAESIDLKVLNSLGEGLT